MFPSLLLLLLPPRPFYLAFNSDGRRARYSSTAEPRADIRNEIALFIYKTDSHQCYPRARARALPPSLPPGRSRNLSAAAAGNDRYGA